MPLDVRNMKRRVALELFEAEPAFKLVIDIEVPGVLLPPNWMRSLPPRVVLELGDGLARPVKDLVFDAEGISGTFSFAQTPFFCRVPWDAVGALVVEGKVGIGWQPLDGPDLATQLVKEAVVRDARSRFKVIEGGGG